MWQRGSGRRRSTSRRGWRVVTPAVLVALCSGAVVVGARSAQAGASSTSTATWHPPACHRPPAPPVVAQPVPGVASDWTITSFDGTRIRAHWFPLAGAGPSHPAPTILMGPGWSEAGDTDLSGTGDLFGTVSIPDLHNDGYNVLTWDPRGFGRSNGTVEVDSPDYEARDVSRLIDWVATQPGVELDAPGDARLGMVGGSYGGGIQWVTAAEDCRVDAITPTIAWHSLATSLDKSGISKIGWGNVLYDAAAADSLDPHIRAAESEGNSTGQVAPAEAAWFTARGPGNLVADVHVPTLVVQGTVDTLFTLDEGITNYQQLRRDHVPVHMLWFCGGHGVCLTNAGDPSTVERATLAWLDRWVKRKTSVHVGPRVDLIDQHGVRYAAVDYPVPTPSTLDGQGSGTLPLVASGGSGPASITPGGAGSGSALAGVAGGILPAKAQTAVDVVVRSSGRTSLAVGAPVVSLTYHGTVAPGPRPSRVFAQLVDDSSGLVVGNQVTPIPVTLDGKSHTTQIPLETICQSVAPGQSLTLQFVATTVAYARPALGGSIHFAHIGVTLPVAASDAVTNLGRA